VQRRRLVTVEGGVALRGLRDGLVGVIAAAAAHGSGQLTATKQRSQVTAMAPSSVAVV
jgi:hypothetical protein